MLALNIQDSSSYTFFDKSNKWCKLYSAVKNTIDYGGILSNVIPQLSKHPGYKWKGNIIFTSKLERNWESTKYPWEVLTDFSYQQLYSQSNHHLAMGYVFVLPQWK